jgi:hypothetical protein
MQTDPQMVHCIMGEKSSMNLHVLQEQRILLLFVTGRREVYMMHSHFPVNTLIKSQYFLNMNLVTAENVNMCNIPLN